MMFDRVVICSFWYRLLECSPNQDRHEDDQFPLYSVVCLCERESNHLKNKTKYPTGARLVRAKEEDY